MVIGKRQSLWPVTCCAAAPAWQWDFWLRRGDYTLKIWPQCVPSKDPWKAGVNQQTGHQGSLDILKMCFRYLGKSVDTFFQCSYRAGTTGGQRDVSGTASAHGTILFGSPGQSVMSLSPSCCLTQRWRQLDIAGHGRLEAWKSDILGVCKPIEQEQRDSVHKNSSLPPENYVGTKDFLHVPLSPAECLERNQSFHRPECIITIRNILRVAKTQGFSLEHESYTTFLPSIYGYFITLWNQVKMNISFKEKNVNKREMREKATSFIFYLQIVGNLCVSWMNRKLCFVCFSKGSW